MVNEEINDFIKQKMEKQGHRIVGNHSAVKICHWTKDTLKGGKGCYKKKFYGISTHQCVQMSPYLACPNFCNFCWRDMSCPPHTTFQGQPDDPKLIVDGCIEAHKKLLIGFWGNDKADKQRMLESEEPKHLAISLIGEPLFYPKMQELIDYAHSKGHTTFIVTCGQAPEEMDKVSPTQLYLSVDAPNEEIFKQIDKSVNEDGWNRLLQSLDALNRARERCRTVIRITCVRGDNMIHPEKYAKLIERANPMFLEVKGFSLIGSARHRLRLKHMPYHEEVKAFAEEISKHCEYKIVDEDPKSKVVLMMKDEKDRFLE